MKKLTLGPAVTFLVVTVVVDVVDVVVGAFFSVCFIPRPIAQNTLEYLVPADV